MEDKILKILSEMEKQLAWDMMQAAEMDEAGRTDEMDMYDKAVSVRKEDIALVKSLLEGSV